jgi:RNA polymerase sigma factor (sigma-70 family)
MGTDPSRTAMLTQARATAYGIALRHLRSPDDADDVAQTALMKLMVQDPVPDNPDAWITRATQNAIVDFVRARDARPGLVTVADDVDDKPRGKPKRVPEAVERFVREGRPVSDAVDRDAIERIWRVLRDQLSDKELELLALTVDGVSQDEIAEQLGYKNANTVKSTLVRIRRKIEDELEQFRLEQGHPRAY